MGIDIGSVSVFGLQLSLTCSVVQCTRGRDSVTVRAEVSSTIHLRFSCLHGLDGAGFMFHLPLESSQFDLGVRLG